MVSRVISSVNSGDCVLTSSGRVKLRTCTLLRLKSEVGL